MVDLKHTTQAVGEDAGDGEIGKAQWNENHALTGAPNQLLGFDGTGVVAEVDPGTFATAAHTQAISTVTGLQDALDAKVGNNRVLTDVPAGAVFTDTVYSHPSYDGDDINIDTGPLTGATVISDLDLNVTTDTQGHVTDANAVVATRLLTPADIGAATAAQGALAGTAVQPADLGTAAAQDATAFATAAQGALADTAVQPADLGTAAAQDATAFATAAQGALADTAVQPGDDADTLGSGAATDGQLLTADGSGGVSWADSSGGSGFVELVADGAISAGDPVVLQSDGTVTEISMSTSAALGTATTFVSNNDDNFLVAYDSTSEKVVVAYRGVSDGYTYAVVGTVSGGSITFGTPVVAVSSNSIPGGIVYDSTNDRVVINCLHSQYDHAIVGTVSGTSISFGADERTSGQYTAKQTSIFDVTDGTVWVAWDAGSSLGMQAGTVSGSSITMGNVQSVFPSSSPQGVGMVYDPDNSQPVLFTESATGDLLAFIVTTTGTSATFSSEIDLSSVSSDVNGGILRACYNTVENRIILAYQETASGNLYAVALSSNGTTLTAGTPLLIDSALGSLNTQKLSIDTYNAESKVAISYSDASGFRKYQVVNVSGSTLTAGAGATYVSNSGVSRVVNNAANDSMVFVYNDNGAAGKARVLVETLTTNADGFIGFAQTTVADTESVAVATTYAVDSNQTGLTPQTTYYVDADGTLSSSDTGYPVAGYALTATKLRVGA